MMGYISNDFEKTLNLEMTWEQRHEVRFYPRTSSERKMTLYGFLAGTVPAILKYLEETDELDLDRRLKIYKLLLITKKIERRKPALTSGERYLMTKSKNEANAATRSRELVADQRLLNNDWKIVK